MKYKLNNRWTRLTEYGPVSEQIGPREFWPAYDQLEPPLPWREPNDVRHHYEFRRKADFVLAVKTLRERGWIEIE